MKSKNDPIEFDEKTGNHGKKGPNHAGLT